MSENKWLTRVQNKSAVNLKNVFQTNRTFYLSFPNSLPGT
ncbi:hypothetical protein SC1083_0161 [Aggregatibacter actinomycetemcomitans serotype e str. SC1083]|uniref:Uncharacterized protein n=1 Tax=Aggregatibacter actinomycetemcomitans serotype e str. SC1083 TaxID=907488 RepID=G4A5S6_AGGAC|nr:hypothetical protein SC1083_0161 [Aggregatibacter actinomycetemcomitans serotype e str. SC1083]